MRHCIWVFLATPLIYILQDRQVKVIAKNEERHWNNKIHLYIRPTHTTFNTYLLLSAKNEIHSKKVLYDLMLFGILKK